MKILVSWLRDYVEFDLPIEEVAHSLTMAGTEVEKIEKRGFIDKVIVGEIQSVREHPNADKLKLVTVDLGSSTVEVVCGAPDLQNGQKVAYAFEGAELFDSRSEDRKKKKKLKKSNIRGIISRGMICSERELGVGENHDGILILEEGTKIGTPIGEVIGDTLLELSLTPNRPDCLGVIGVAREISAIHDLDIKAPETSFNEGHKNVSSLCSVKIEDPNLCYRYLGAIIEGIKVAPSPKWLQDRLIAIGERPINNVVDVTNYVMFELGQPLHAFDYRNIAEQQIIVRRAKPEESVVTLDGVHRDLNHQTLVIADNKKVIGLAGIMGAENTEVSEGTEDIFLEAATFDSSNNRISSKNLELSTEATLRFEKGLKPGLAEVAINRAISMILDIAGGTAAKGIIDVNPKKESDKKSVLLEKNHIKKVLGIHLDSESVEKTLKKLGFKLKKHGDDWNILVPYWRPDITIAEDLIEELARIIGYDSIPIKTIQGDLPIWEPSKDLELRDKIVDYLVGFGMREIISYTGTSIESEKRINLPDDLPPYTKILNPISSEFNILRRSLREGILTCAAKNSNTWNGPIAIFEIGRIFLDYGKDLPQEKLMLVGGFTGPRFANSWDMASSMSDFYDAKGAVELVLEKLHINPKFTPFTDGTFSKGRSASIYVGEDFKQNIGCIGEVKPEIVSLFDGKIKNVSMFEIDLDTLLDVYTNFNMFDVYSSFSRYQESYRDLSIVIDRTESVGSIVDIAKNNSLVSKVTVTDLYQGDDIPKDKKVVTIRMIYQSENKSLLSENIAKIESKIIGKLKKSLGADLRT
jgi:phenylalanyl-tRNA synthetase beta chain|tara:strand:- start:5305 stop:7728 length:2424 start_codon:yes stop_codon:yes gene_type:complete